MNEDDAADAAALGPEFQKILAAGINSGVAAARVQYGTGVLNLDGTLTPEAYAAGWRIEQAQIDVTQNAAHPETVPGHWDLIPPDGWDGLPVPVAASNEPPDPIGVVSAKDYEDLISGGLDADTIREVVRMHRGLHPDASMPLSPDACKEPGHTWAEMITRYHKLDGTPQLPVDEPLRHTATAASWALAQAGLTIEPDNTIVVDGKCPACMQGTLRIGVRASSGLPSNSVVCVNSSCQAPGTVNKLLHLDWGNSHTSRARKLHRVENVDLPDGPVEAGQADLLARYRPPAVEVAAVNESQLNNGRDENGTCTECGSTAAQMHPNWCSWAPRPDLDDDDGDLFNLAFDQFAVEDDSESGSLLPARVPFTPAAHPVGPDPADRSLYTCHPDRCGATPQAPCKAARESLDAQHNDVITLEVPDV